MYSNTEHRRRVLLFLVSWLPRWLTAGYPTLLFQTWIYDAATYFSQTKSRYFLAQKATSVAVAWGFGLSLAWASWA